jgi:8-oxo-dGTP pyrophosphatase MutT (NUDIX family)
MCSVPHGDGQMKLENADIGSLMAFQLTEEFITEKLRLAYQPGLIASTDGFPDEFQNLELKCAAVLLPLVWQESGWNLVFTRRTEGVEHHKGQVSFPGGGCEPGEADPVQTALREAGEEIGLQPADLRVLGRLNDVLTITHYQVTPVVGVMPWPYPVRLELAEVARVFTIPLSWLADRRNWDEKPVTLASVTQRFSLVTYHPYDGETLWGITARMTLNFLSLLGILNI